MVLSESFDTVQTIRELAQEVEDLKRAFEALKGGPAEAPAKKPVKAARSSETMS